MEATVTMTLVDFEKLRDTAAYNLDRINGLLEIRFNKVINEYEALDSPELSEEGIRQNKLSAGHFRNALDIINDVIGLDCEKLNKKL